MNPKLLLSLFLGVNTSFFVPAVSLAAATNANTQASVRQSSIEVEVSELNRASSQPILVANRRNDHDNRRNNDVDGRRRNQVNPGWQNRIDPRWRNNADAGRRNNDGRRRDNDNVSRNRRVILIRPWR